MRGRPDAMRLTAPGTYAASRKGSCDLSIMLIVLPFLLAITFNELFLNLLSKPCHPRGHPAFFNLSEWDASMPQFIRPLTSGSFFNKARNLYHPYSNSFMRLLTQFSLTVTLRPLAQ